MRSEERENALSSKMTVTCDRKRINQPVARSQMVALRYRFGMRMKKKKNFHTYI